MNSLQTELHTITAEYTNRIVAVVQRAIAEAVGTSIRGAAAPKPAGRRGPKPGKAKAAKATPVTHVAAKAAPVKHVAKASKRSKGAKRAPEEIKQTTEALLAFVKSHSGQRIEQIAKAMKVTTKDLALPAKKLLATRKLKTRGQKRATQYFSALVAAASASGSARRQARPQAHRGCSLPLGVPFLCQVRDDAVEGARLLLGHGRALQERPQVLHHVRPHRRVAQKPRLVQRALEMVEHALELFLGRQPCGRGLTAEAFSLPDLTRHRPFVGDQQHGLGHVEGRELGVERDGERGVGVHQIFVLEPGPLGSEQEPDPFASADPRSRVGRRVPRGDDSLGQISTARRRRHHPLEIGHRGRYRIERLRVFQNHVGAGRRPVGLGVGPSVARAHDAQPGQAAIEHGARGHPDVLTELRTHQDDHGYGVGRRVGSSPHGSETWRGPYPQLRVTRGSP